ncbi:lipid droplet-regulating VLDL assembly factor AUP1-like [Ostrea edulis]|uniref:lipid droplet-regulating VLDL assembly factor AUP1-like n=1 Tax=Ostrea edulis TaxID=37623 RepID=UPI0020947256|nr:lipid droplet-regulating VLDL assembly factor AUP1-like [Ostrea edulis]
MEMESLFNINRIPDSRIKLMTALYFPFGVALVIIRLFITLHALLVTCILPKCAATSLILKTIFGIIGIQVVIQEDKRRDKSAKVIVSNHVSNLDHMIIDFIIANITPDIIGLSSCMQWLTGFKDFGSSKGADILEENIKKFVRESKFPVLLHPEKTTTNGTGLLKFMSFPFSLGKVQPVVLQVTRWPMTMAVTTLTSNIYQDFLWSLFVPYTIYKVKLLPEEECGEEESVENFAERVRGNMAECLNVPLTEYTWSDKQDLVKRLEEARKKEQQRSARQRPTGNSALHRTSSDPELQRMIQQVQDVLPDIPAAVILEDLEKTREVDLTITNILEGKVSTEPQKNSQTSDKLSHIRKKINVDMAPSQQKYGDTTFHPVASNRMLSLEERKQIMLETARQRYKEKHGLL